VALAACDKPPIDDPAEVAYRRAMELFAGASAASHDLTYRDPRFDAVLAALAEVPRSDPLGIKAYELGQKIERARADADRADHESNAAVSQALAPVPFNALPRDVPLPASAKPVAGAATTDRGPSELQNLGGVGLSNPIAERKLPDWYRRAGYFGAGKRPGAPTPPGEADRLGPPPPPDEMADSPPPTPPPAADPTPSPPPPPPGPPPVFGLPGPAGRALGR
jgi:hypothetical protein